jgi:hypothetical protein
MGVKIIFYILFNVIFYLADPDPHLNPNSAALQVKKGAMEDRDTCN